MVVRQWIEEFKTGIYTKKGTEYMFTFWEDWCCRDVDLIKRLEEIGEFVQLITNAYILDNFTLSLKNCDASVGGGTNDVIKLEAQSYGLKDTESFGVAFFDAEEGCDYALFTSRNNGHTEFKVDTLEDLIKHINGLGVEWKTKHDDEDREQKEYDDKIDAIIAEGERLAALKLKKEGM